MRKTNRKQRRRPNEWENRHNQWVVAGKIAVKTGAINPYEPDGSISPIYNSSGNINYSVIGQDYLHQLGIEVEELVDRRQVLRDAIEKSGLSIERIAVSIALDRETIYNYLAGRSNIASSTYNRIMEIL